MVYCSWLALLRPRFKLLHMLISAKERVLLHFNLRLRSFSPCFRCTLYAAIFGGIVWYMVSLLCSTAWGVLLLTVSGASATHTSKWYRGCHSTCDRVHGLKCETGPVAFVKVGYGKVS